MSTTVTTSARTASASVPDPFEHYLPDDLPSLSDHQRALPTIAKSERLTALIDEAVQRIPTRHDLHVGEQRIPGGYRSPSVATRVLSVISDANHKQWFQQIWSDVTGASTRNHPAPYPLQLAERLIRMFSFVGDTVLDPFVGTGTTMLVAAQHGRHSIGYEVDASYADSARRRIEDSLSMFSSAGVTFHAES
jgi:hypothetical protein